MNLADVAALEQLLASDAILVVDGDASTPIRGGSAVARYVADLFGQHGCRELALAHVNGSTGLVLASKSDVVAVATLSVSATHIRAVWIVLNRDKLRSWRRPTEGSSWI